MDEAENNPSKPKLPIRPNRIAIRPPAASLTPKDTPSAPAPTESSNPPAASPPSSEPEGIRPPPSIFNKDNLPSYADEMFGRSTIRIELPPEADKKRETTRIELPPAAKKETTRIELPSAAAEQKSTTIALGIPAATSTGPAKPKRPGALIMKRPGTTAGATESIDEQPGKTATITRQARNSETARIDLSLDQPEATDEKPKTIRIKRPETATGKKPLSIARPQQGKKATAATLAEPEIIDEEEENAPSLVAGITAIAALLVAGFLFYMLLAQSIAPGLPFPGKI